MRPDASPHVGLTTRHASGGVTPRTTLGSLTLARLRTYFRNRRGASRLPYRCEVRVTAGVSFEPRTGATLISHTVDISEGGLAIVVQQISLDKFTIAEGQQLSLVLSLAGRAVGFTAEARNVRRVEEGGPEVGYVLGLRITRMGEEERGLLRAFLRESL